MDRDYDLRLAAAYARGTIADPLSDIATLWDALAQSFCSGALCVAIEHALDLVQLGRIDAAFGAGEHDGSATQQAIDGGDLRQLWGGKGGQVAGDGGGVAPRDGSGECGGQSRSCQIRLRAGD